MTRACRKEYLKQYYLDNKEHKKQYYQDNIEYFKQYRDANKEKREVQMRQWNLDNPKRKAYQSQKACAKHRGIEWLFTYEEWIGWWGDDWSRRGKGANDLCMARIGDTGPYSIDNVVKATNAENAAKLI